MIYNIFMRASTLSAFFGKRKLFFALIVLIFLVSCTFISTLQVSRGPVKLEGDSIAAVTDRDYFPLASQAIASSEDSIRMIIYNMNYYVSYPDSSVNLLIGALGDAAARGVDVRVIVDGNATEKPVLSILKESGVNIKFDSKDTTTHAKLIIIDSKIVIIGSTNWSYYSVEKNHEANVVINSPELAQQFEAYFNGIWMES